MIKIELDDLRDGDMLIGSNSYIMAICRCGGWQFINETKLRSKECELVKKLLEAGCYIGREVSEPIPACIYSKIDLKDHNIQYLEPSNMYVVRISSDALYPLVGLKGFDGAAHMFLISCDINRQKLNDIQKFISENLI